MMFLPLLLVGSVLQVAMTGPNSSDQATFQRLESEWNDAHVRADASALARLYGDDVVIVVPGMRVMTKSDALGMLQPGRMTFQRYETSELQIRVYDQTAIVTGRLQRTRVIADRKADDDWRFTKVYARRVGGWQVISFHASNTATQ